MALATAADRKLSTMPLDPDIRAYLDGLAAQNAPKLWELPVETLRENRRQLQAQVEHVPVASVEDRKLDGPGGPLPIRIYRPTADDQPAPLLVYLHGGGFVFGDLDSSDPISRQLCRETQMVVVSVEYRLAPEHRYPAAVEDSLLAVEWCQENAASFGADAGRMIVAGDSAGGNLAINAARELTARAEGPALLGLVLIYPTTDMRDLPYPSRTDYAEGYGLSAADMEWFYEQYVPDLSVIDEPWASPLLAPDLGRLPPTLVLTAEYDPLRSEGEALAARLKEVGVDVEYGCLQGMNHGALTNAEGFAAAHRLRARIVAWSRQIVNSAG